MEPRRLVSRFLGSGPTGTEVAWEGAALFETDGGRLRTLWVLGGLAGLTAKLERQAAGEQRIRSRRHSVPASTRQNLRKTAALPQRRCCI